MPEKGCQRDPTNTLRAPQEGLGFPLILGARSGSGTKRKKLSNLSKLNKKLSILSKKLSVLSKKLSTP